jgi:hypothetical protein
VNADILFANSQPFQNAGLKEIDVSPDTTVKRDNYPSIATRFKVEILVKDKDDKLRALPMQAVMRNYGDGDFADGDFYIDLNRNVYYDEEYQIRLTNGVYRPMRWKNPNAQMDVDRLYCAAVFIDGVNSIFEEHENEKKIEYYATQRHPRYVSKWVLAPPKHVIAKNYITGMTPQEGKFESRNSVNPDESIADILGFQTGQEARAFKFADSGESVAHELGITKEIGMITVYFFAELLKDDKSHYPPRVRPADATKIGKSIPNPVRNIIVHTHPDPIEIWRIHYRYNNQPNSVEKARKELENEGKRLVPIAKAIDTTRRFQDGK